MIETPEVHFADSHGVSIAYQQWGSGPHFIGLPPFAQNLEMMWEEPNLRRLLERMGTFATVTQFDKRGTGLSERIIGVASLEERMDDFRAVMDAVGVERASVGGVSEGGPLAILFAATYPERVEKLALHGTFAAASWTIDETLTAERDVTMYIIEELARHWGTPESISVAVFFASMAGDEVFARWVQRYERHCCSPNAVRELMRLNVQIDVRSALPLVQAPTLVMHRTDDPAIRIASGRYVADHIPGATFVELPGKDHVPWIGDQDAWFDAFEGFLCGESSGSVDVDRALATVLFTDIVGSTDRASALGDRRWHHTLDLHDSLVRRRVDHHRGRVVKTTGDGALATFDSPARALRAAAEVRDGVGDLGLEIRAGLHTGEVELRGDDVAGVGVHIAARVAGLAAASEVLVSRTVCDLVLGSEFRFEDRGDHLLKGVEGDWRLMALAPSSR